MSPPAVIPFHFDPTSTLMWLHLRIKGVLGFAMVPVKLFIASFIGCVGIIWAIAAANLLMGMHTLGCSEDILQRIRRLCLLPLRLGARLVLYCLGFWYIKTSGTPCSESEARIIVSNHCSAWEIIYLFWMYGPIFVSRIENQQITGMYSVLSLCGTIFVDRSNANSRKEVLHRISDIASSPSSSQICIFPEGTTTSGKSLAGFKIGAFHPGKTIQPVVFRFPWKHHDPTWPTSGNSTLLSMLLGMYSQYGNHMEATFLPPYTPSHEEKKNVSFFANNVREMMLQHVK